MSGIWYLVKVDALIGALIFSAAGVFILSMFVWEEAKAYAAVSYRMYRRFASRRQPTHHAA
jgi:hypothetical protein